jgi:hypothetical protein
MTEEAWLELTPYICMGDRAMEIVRDNPQWWMLEILDGFGPHTLNLEAMQIRDNHKILCLKEEANSSHVNQTYDRNVAKGDKASARYSLANLRTWRQVTKGKIDQYHLLHVGLGCVRDTKPSTWIHSFWQCNLDPRTAIPFVEWCKQIKPFLHAGQNFKAETDADLDPYALLPAWWHGMLPAEKKKAVAVINKHSGFTVACCRELRDVCHIPLQDQQNLRLCYELAKSNPHHLDMGVPSKETIEHVSEQPELQPAADAIGNVTDCLVNFELKPTKLLDDKEKLFEHMIKFRKQTTSEQPRRSIH